MIAALVLVLLADAPAPSLQRGWWSIHAGGGLAAAAPAYSASVRYPELAEETSLTTRQTPRSGVSFEGGLWHAPERGLGAAIVVSREHRDAPGSFAAAIPHPLYLDRPRLAEGTLPGASRRETAIHVGLVWSIPLDRSVRTVARLIAGPSYVLVDADLAERVAYDDAYPYDAVAVTAVRTSAARGGGVGGHVGLGLERRIRGRAALGAGIRWSRATVHLGSGTGDTAREAEVPAGGVSAALGLRLYF